MIEQGRGPLGRLIHAVRSGADITAKGISNDTSGKRRWHEPPLSLPYRTPYGLRWTALRRIHPK